jgi:hypothetical protein
MLADFVIKCLSWSHDYSVRVQHAVMPVSMGIFMLFCMIITEGSHGLVLFNFKCKNAVLKCVGCSILRVPKHSQ